MKFCKQCNCFLPTSEEKHVGLCLEHIELRDESLGITESDRRAEHSNMKRKTLKCRNNALLIQLDSNKLR
jgi:hypothetical protein